MTKTFLIATVAAFAITAPAQAELAEQRASSEQRANKAERASKAERAQQRAARAQARPKAAERRQQRVRAERPQARERVRAERPKARVRAERPQARERVRAERPQARERVRVQRQAEKVERRARPQERAVERRARNAERVRPQRVERQRVERQPRAQRIERIQNRGMERRTEVQARNAERFAAKRELQQQRKAERQQLQQQRQAQRFERIENRLERRNGRIELRNQRTATLAQQRLMQRPTRIVGDRIDVRQRQENRDWYDAYLAQRYSAYGPTSRYFYDYDYDDGYLYQVSRDTNLVTALFPLLGGAFGVGQPMPIGYGGYNVPYAYRSLYYDTPYSQFRYGSGAIYRVDPETQLIQAVVALLTGQSLGIGQTLPMGYDVYNVPYAYRSTYFDSDDMWYRYSDGYIYGVDPFSRRIEAMYPVSYGGYAVGYPVPSYASYGGYTGFGGFGGYPNYSVPYGYQNLYYSQPGYNYHYANGGIYQVDPATQLISALVALVTGTSLGVGQMLPMGYDAYNVPYAYRGSYFDTADAWYRYDDGYIYQVDPRSRIIQASIPVSYGGYMVGQPVPAAYPGYAVPNQYSGLYYAAPGYDYRYFDGGIYAVNPQTQIVQSQVALLTGQTFGVGQMLPMGYDVYNVPFAYRDRYYDTNQYMYRYADGYIYQVDPTTRLIQAVIDAVV